MPNNNPVFVFDGKLCKFEGMTKEQIINAIVEATGVTPSDVDAGFISTIVEQNNSRSVHFWFGTQAEYDALETYDSNTFYIIDGDATIDDLEAGVQNADEEIDEVREDLQAVDTDLQGFKDSLTFLGGTPSQDGFTTAKDIQGGSIVTNNPLPSSGLYLFYVKDTTVASGSVTSGVYSSVVAYVNSQTDTFSMSFRHMYYNENASAPRFDPYDFYLEITSARYVNLHPCYRDGDFGVTNYRVLYRKIG